MGLLITTSLFMCYVILYGNIIKDTTSTNSACRKTPTVPLNSFSGHLGATCEWSLSSLTGKDGYILSYQHTAHTYIRQYIYIYISSGVTDTGQCPVEVRRAIGGTTGIVLNLMGHNDIILIYNNKNSLKHIYRNPPV